MSGRLKGIIVSSAFILVAIGCYGVFVVIDNIYTIHTFVEYKLEPCNSLTEQEKEGCIKNIADGILYTKGLLRAFEFLNTAFQVEEFVGRGCLWDTQTLKSYTQELLSQNYTEGDTFVTGGTIPRIIYNCYFSLGEGFVSESSWRMELTDPSEIWNESIPFCVLISNRQREQNECVEGVFGAVITFMKEQRYGLSYNRKDLFYWCEKQSERYKTLCYYEFARTSPSNKDGFSDISEILLQVPTEPLKSLVTRAVVPTAVRNKIAIEDIESFVLECRSVRFSDTKDTCLKAIVVGVWESSQSGHEFETGSRFCKESLLTQGEKDICFQTLAKELGVIYSVPKMRNICEDFPPKYKDVCTIDS